MWESLIEHAKENGGTIVVELATKTRELRWDEATEKFYDNDKMQYESVTYDEVKLIFNGTFDGNKRSGSKMQKWYNGKAIVDYMKTHFAKQSVPNKVFIIDEINRGNISKIFGELITLIEPSKRGGAREAMSVKLPYSGDDFTVPQNIYILGTMNTADRSIALMDTALRRRFKFKEMLPDTSGLGFEIDGVNIKSLLDRINERIELLYDREHTIGHSFFMSLKENNDISALADVFEKDIIPLLQEYFYGDYEKIRLVFANNDFITVKDVNDPVLIDVDIATKYEINKEKLKDPEEYKKIYS
ncbi:MAG: hypothetical protein E7652_02530 [Ruminococcaceae bacterium]|nr:hypothetical protein [Oscillospiraceae bacterium]